MGYRIKKNFLEFYVLDTGKGIKPEEKSLIFERFRQADDSITRAYGGTGLGLTISKAFTENLGGSIRFDSNVNEGTTFYFTIPFKKLKKTTMDTNQNSTQITKSFKDRHILLVEDDEINTYYFLEILKKTGARIIYAKNGNEAIEKVSIFPTIDIILMDIKMPEMNGYEAFDEIRKMNKKIPIIAQTAYAMENDKKKIINYGFDGYLTKPINTKELIAVLNQFLKNKEAAEDS